ncbi:MAG TPA: ArsA family ATPase [Polyangia bacterium]|nr:ArsA family ATPase [Polyangia bacterium]
MPDLLDKRLIVVAGKGGVGRTTVSMIVGRSAGRRGRDTLVCLVNAPLRYADLLGGVALGPEPRRIGERLHVANLEPRAAREEYGLQVLQSPTLHRLVFGGRMVQAFLDAVPGLAEWAVFGKASYHALREIEGRPEYDLVIFDSPATGHGLEILSLPRAILAGVPGGRMREEAARRVELMADPARFEVLPVTIPEELAVNETIELVEALSRMGFPARRVVVNGVAVDDTLDSFAALLAGPAGQADWLLPGVALLARREAQRRSLERLREATGLPLLLLPQLGTGGLDEASWLSLARLFDKTVADPDPLRSGGTDEGVPVG